MSQAAVRIIAHIIVLLTVPFHEVAHGLVSLWLGDPTAKNAGRLTLNPLRHMDLFGSLSMLIVGIGLFNIVAAWINQYLCACSNIITGRSRRNYPTEPSGWRTPKPFTIIYIVIYKITVPSRSTARKNAEPPSVPRASSRRSRNF